MQDFLQHTYTDAHRKKTHLYTPSTNQQQCGVLVDLGLAWQQRRVRSCGSTKSLMCRERWGERMCQRDLEKPAGKGRGYSREISEVGEGLALVLTLSQSTNVSSSPSPHLPLSWVCTLFFFLNNAYHFHLRRIVALRVMILQAWWGFENYSKASIMREAQTWDKCKFMATI